MKAIVRLLGLFLLAAAANAGMAPAQDAVLSKNGDSVKFAVIGDSGSGSVAQYAVGKQMADARVPFPFEFVIMRAIGRLSPGPHVKLSTD